jgi:hypothetical protein
MKALISAFALLSFVAATTVPYVAAAQTQAPPQHMVTKHSKAKKVSTHKTTKKHIAKSKKVHKTASKKKPAPTTVKG